MVKRWIRTCVMSLPQNLYNNRESFIFRYIEWFTREKKHDTKWIEYIFNNMKKVKLFSKLHLHSSSVKSWSIKDNILGGAMHSMEMVCGTFWLEKYPSLFPATDEWCTFKLTHYARLKVHLGKCQFVVDNIYSLGHTLSVAGQNPRGRKNFRLL